MFPEERLAELGLQLPPAPKPLGVYQPIVIVGDIAYLSGHVPLRPDGSIVTGRVGQDLDQQTAHRAARLVGLALLATLRNSLGSLDRVERVIKVFGMVNCTPDFDQQPAVINGCSELLVELFGVERGVAARSAMGAGSLPGNIPVEIEAVFQIRSATTP